MTLVGALIGIVLIIILSLVLGPLGIPVVLAIMFGMIFSIYQKNKQFVKDLSLIKEKLGVEEKEDHMSTDEEIEEELEGYIEPEDESELSKLLNKQIEEELEEFIGNEGDRDVNGGYRLFNINYRIVMNMDEIASWSVKKFDDEGDLQGFFEMVFKGHSYGYYHSRPLGDDERGFDSITNWFERLLNLYILLRTNNYVAISDTNSYIKWLQFVKVEPADVEVSLIDNENKSWLSDIVTTTFNQMTYSDWKGVVISLEELKTEIILKTELYIEELRDINKKLLYSNRIKILTDLLQKVK